MNFLTIPFKKVGPTHFQINFIATNILLDPFFRKAHRVEDPWIMPRRLDPHLTPVLATLYCQPPQTRHVCYIVCNQTRKWPPGTVPQLKIRTLRDAINHLYNVVLSVRTPNSRPHLHILCVHTSSDEVFSKILKKPSVVQK